MFSFNDDISLVKDVGSSYTYDSESNVVSVESISGKESGHEYSTVTNLPTKYTDGNGNSITYEYGAIVSILDKDGNDISDLSIGNNAEHVGNINPIRYKGYYYDSETGLYYLQSRYYDADVGRFINSDSQLNKDTLGNNLFAYCSNNPIMRVDESGEFWGTVFRGNQDSYDILKVSLSAASVAILSVPRYEYKPPEVDYSSNISPGEYRRIQNAANRTHQRIDLVGSRAGGTSNTMSDWDYIMYGNSSQRGSASSSVLRGFAGGGNESGIDIFSGYPNGPNPTVLDTSKPYISFYPQ